MVYDSMLTPYSSKTWEEIIAKSLILQDQSGGWMLPTSKRPCKEFSRTINLACKPSNAR